MRLQTGRMLAKWMLAERVSIRGWLQFKWLHARAMQISKRPGFSLMLSLWKKPSFC